MSEKKRGPVEILCKEIGVRFTPDLEKPKVLIAFVRVLCGRLEYMFEINSFIEKRRHAPVDMTDARRSIDKLKQVLAADDPATLVAGAGAVHDLIHAFQWQGNWASHVFDIVGSLASALRFGLDERDEFGSRHAAEAANHLWRHEYGVSKFDEFTGDWQKSWACAQFDEGMKRLAFGTSKQVAEVEVEEQVRPEGTPATNPLL